MELSFEIKERIGFLHILDAMHPCSPYGQEMLKKIKPASRTEHARLETELTNLQKFVEHRPDYKQEIRTIQHAFMQMKNIRLALKKMREMTLDEIELFELKNFLLCTENVRKPLQLLSAKLGLADLVYAETLPALDLLDPDQRRISAFSVCDSYSEVLREIRSRKKEAEQRLSKADGEEWDRIKEERRQIAAAEEAEELRVREDLTGRLRAYADAMAHNIEVTARLDLLLEKSALALRGKTAKPVITKDHLKLAQAVNPYVEQLLKERDQAFTPIDIALDPGATVITGANMGGKSVALQTIALNTYLALCGFYVYAREAQIPHFSEMIMVSEDMQSVSRGLSSFGAEVMQLQEAVETAERSFSFVIFDEFSRGTNPHEGEALVRSVVRFFNARGAVVLLVTHYDHVAEYANAHYQVKGLTGMDPAQVKTEIAAGGKQNGVAVIASHMDYGLYRVTDRKDCPREALNICALLGLDERILKLADADVQPDFL